MFWCQGVWGIFVVSTIVIALLACLAWYNAVRACDATTVCCDVTCCCCDVTVVGRDLLLL